jgi:hypothetical protein
MFAEMRAALGIDKKIDILDHVYALPTDEQEEAQEKIREIERVAMKAQKAQVGESFSIFRSFIYHVAFMLSEGGHRRSRGCGQVMRQPIFFQTLTKTYNRPS